MSAESAKIDTADLEVKTEAKEGTPQSANARLRPGPNRQNFEEAVEATLRQHEVALRILAGETPEKAEDIP